MKFAITKYLLSIYEHSLTPLLGLADALREIWRILKKVEIRFSKSDGTDIHLKPCKRIIPAQGLIAKFLNPHLLDDTFLESSAIKECNTKNKMQLIFSSKKGGFKKKVSGLG